MKIFLYSCLLFFFLISSGLCNPALTLTKENLPPDFEATYDVYKKGIHAGEMHVTLKRNGDSVLYESSTKPVGLAALFLGNQEIIDYAELKLIEGAYRPIEFEHEMKNSDKNRYEHYIFDWENKKADITYKDRKNILELPPNTFDSFTMQLLLMREPSQGVSENNYPVISKGRLKQYLYMLENSEVLKTKLGEFDTNKLVRRKDDEEKTIYLGWYAESLNYIPVKLDKIENDKIDVSIQISKISWL